MTGARCTNFETAKVTECAKETSGKGQKFSPGRHIECYRLLNWKLVDILLGNFRHFCYFNIRRKFPSKKLNC